MKKGGDRRREVYKTLSYLGDGELIFHRTGPKLRLLEVRWCRELFWIFQRNYIEIVLNLISERSIILKSVLMQSHGQQLLWRIDSDPF